MMFTHEVQNLSFRKERSESGLCGFQNELVRKLLKQIL